MPAPLDTIVGLYHPYRDVVWDGLTSGVPFKNFLITDPVRQQIPWRYLAIEEIKNLNFISWNPYSFSGTPLTSNIQTAAFYPLNIIFFIFPFTLAWTMLIISTPILSGLFMFFYLRQLRLQQVGAIVGSLVFGFSGFMVAWMEWGTVGQVLLWLPLILTAKERLLTKFTFKWLFILAFSEICMFLAGHLQTAFYVVLFSSFYLVFRLIQYSYNEKVKIKSIKFLNKLIPFLISSLVVLAFIAPQYLLFLKLLSLSARNFDLPSWDTESWFLPLNQLIQFIAPDFFGNPSTLNYWGQWNYAEFVGYIGILPLTLFIIGSLFVNTSIAKFYKVWVVIVLVMIIRNPISEIPFKLSIPFFDSAQPTRLLSIGVFCMATLAAFGFEFILNLKQKKINKTLLLSFLFIPLFILVSWLYILNGEVFVKDESTLLSLVTVSRRNLIVPTVLVFVNLILILLLVRTKKKVIIYLLLLISIADLFRFGHKFLSFSTTSWFYPQTEVIRFLQGQNGFFRTMTTDRRILAPNFSVMYKLYDVSGYDPIYLLRYSQLVTSWQNNVPILKPSSFNRILTPQNYNSFIADLLGVKYVLSLTDIESDKLKLVLKEGETRVYENTDVLPRAFLVSKIIKVDSDQSEMEALFANNYYLSDIATSQQDLIIEESPIALEEQAFIEKYEPNSVKINLNVQNTRLLVLTDIYYPGWKAYIDGESASIYQVDYLFRGVVVPAGNHVVEFKFN